MASSDTCFTSALLDLEFLKNNISPESVGKQSCDILSKQIRNLRTFHQFARRWGKDYVDDYENDAISLEAFLVEIEDAVSTIAQNIHPFCVSSEGQLAERLWHHLVGALKKVGSFKENINRWYIKFSDCSRQSTSSCSSGDLVEFIDSILGTLDYFSGQNSRYIEYQALVILMETLEEEITFLKNFIRLFTALRAGSTTDDDRHLGQNLLTHIKAVAVSAAHHSYQCAFGHYDEDLTELKFKISGQLQRIKPVDPLVYQTYIQALNGSKLSRRQPPSLETLEIFQDFITSLLIYLFEILRTGTIPVFSNKDRVQILYEGLRSLRTVLKKQPKNFDGKMQDFTGAVVCDAGVVIFSLFQDVTEDDFARKMDHLLFDLLDRIMLIRAEVAGVSPEGERSYKFNFSKVDELGCIDFLLENLKELTSREEEATGSTAIPKHQIQTIYEQLVFLRSFLGKIVQFRDEKEELQTLWNHIMELAYRIEFLIDSLVIGHVPDDSSCQMSFDFVTQEINILKLDALKISDKEDLNVAKRSSDFLPLERSLPTIKDEIIHLDDEVTTIMDRLKGGAKKLQIVPIVGMPGLGKTTLAKLVYNNSLITSHFHVRAWCCISQVYDKENLLLDILNCISSGHSDKCEEDLAQLLRQNLLRKKYLIVLDDVWNIDVWNILKDSFPDDKNGSRILLTSRLQDVARDVALEEILDREPHCLRRLSDDESWKLLKAKLFPRCEWPPTLCEFGIKIAKRCKGLPLIIVILAGFLATSEQNDWAKVVERCLSSSSTNILEQCNNILELSYKYLPDELKPCFLYFGAFPEDQKHTASELTLLWIAEGFVRKAQSKSLEDTAKDYLMHLINRSLVMVDKKSSTSMVKSCHIHDLLHVFCLEKAKKYNFFQILNEYDELFDFSELQNIRRLWIHCTIEHFKKSRLSYPRLLSVFFGRNDNRYWFLNYGLNPLSYVGNSKLVRVLDLRQIGLGDMFPDELTSMVHLRWLAIAGYFRSIPTSIANLSNLETLIVDSDGMIELPIGFWKLRKLRLLKSKRALFRLTGEYGDWVELFNFKTFSTLSLCWRDLESVLKMFPNIRKLKVVLWEYGTSAESGKNSKVLVLDSLSRIESLMVSGDKKFVERQIDICFPKNLKKLTLEGLCLPWCKISAIGKLPNLEVLKLFNNAFKGENWSMEEAGQFPKLRFLKLYNLNIVRWTASESVQDHFPHLVKLVLAWCSRLKGVPSCLGDISSLQMIQAFVCSKSVASSVEKVYENQVDMGKEDLKVLIDQCRL